MSETNFSLVDLKALTKPAVKLIEAVHSAVGALYEPTRIRRKAKAEADAVVILAKSQMKVREIEARASERLQNKELRRQENIENITKKALDSLPQEVSKDPVDDDWVYQFFEHCQDIGNKQMQSLWAKLLAGEVATPGSFSIRTLRLVKEMGKDDAQLFTNFCTFVWQVPNTGLLPVITSIEAAPIAKSGLTFKDYLHLDALGLIKFENLTGFSLKELTKNPFFYYGKQHIISAKQGNMDLPLGKALLTGIGMQLAPIAGSLYSEEYRCYVVEEWRKQGFIVEE